MGNVTNYKQEIHDWTTYTQYLAAFAGFVRTADLLLSKKMKNDSTFDKIDASLRSLYLSIQSVDQEFVNGIQSMEAGNEPTFSFNPVTVPAWPDASGDTSTGTETVLSDVWQTVKPVLESWLGKIKVSSSTQKAAFETVLVGLIKSGDDVVAELNTVFA